MSNSSQLHRLVYRSEMANSFTQSQLQEILKLAKNNNSKQDITGILVARGKIFLQFLEGDINKITDLFNKIKKDVRHKNVEVLLNEPADSKIFTNWTMGLVDEATLLMSLPEVMSMIDLIMRQNAKDKKSKILEILKVFSTNYSTLSMFLK